MPTLTVDRPLLRTDAPRVPRGECGCARAAQPLTTPEQAAPLVSVTAAEQNVQCFLLLTAHRITKRNPSRPSPLASLAGLAQSMSSLEDDGPPKPPAQPNTDQLPRALLLAKIGAGSGAHQACRPYRLASRPALSKRRCEGNLRMYKAGSAGRTTARHSTRHSAWHSARHWRQWQGVRKGQQQQGRGCSTHCPPAYPAYHRRPYPPSHPSASTGSCPQQY